MGEVFDYHVERLQSRVLDIRAKLTKLAESSDHRSEKATAGNRLLLEAEANRLENEILSLRSIAETEQG